MTIAAILISPAQPAFAQSGCEPASDSYNCRLMPYKHGWRHVTSLTYCFPTQSKDVRYTDGVYHGVQLPPGYQQAAKAAANIWDDRPGLAVGLTLTACNRDTDIRFYGYHRDTSIQGQGNCSEDGQDYCVPGSGIVWFNLNVPYNDTYAQSWVRAGVHELGHVLGLDHPCGNTCDGPVMSYASCRNGSDCPAYPNYDDVAGLQTVYGWTDGGSGGCRLDQITASTTIYDGSIPSGDVMSVLPDEGDVRNVLNNITQNPLPDPTSLLPDASDQYPSVDSDPSPEDVVADATGLISLVPSDPTSIVPDVDPAPVVTEVNEEADKVLAVVSAIDLLSDGPADFVYDAPPEGTPLPPIGGSIVVGAQELVARLADPSVDAYATLVSTAGSINRDMRWVLDKVGLDETVPDPARCVSL